MEYVAHNWAGNVAYRAACCHEPTSVGELQSVIADAARVRAIGSRHSFNTIADTEGEHVSLAALERVAEIDLHERTVTVDGGITYAELASYLESRGMALANLASLPHISVAGACATATHGSGIANGNLATAVRAMQLITANGDPVEISREHNSELMDAATVGLGALGVVTRLTLDIEPTFTICQFVYEALPMPSSSAELHLIMADGYSVSLFTTWRHDNIEQMWRKVRVVPGDDDEALASGATRFGATAATRNLHPLPDLSAEPCTEQMGVPGPWHERLPHFRMGFTPSSGDELQSELFVDEADAIEVIGILRSLGQAMAPVLKISEVRAVAADALWLSPCLGRNSIAFHFTWISSWSQVEPVLATLESALEPFGARPHWGKLTTIDSAALRARFDRLAAFGDLAAEWDPTGKFRNPFLDAVLG